MNKMRVCLSKTKDTITAVIRKIVVLQQSRRPFVRVGVPLGLTGLGPFLGAVSLTAYLALILGYRFHSAEILTSVIEKGTQRQKLFGSDESPMRTNTFELCQYP